MYLTVVGLHPDVDAAILVGQHEEGGGHVQDRERNRSLGIPFNLNTKLRIFPEKNHGFSYGGMVKFCLLKGTVHDIFFNFTVDSIIHSSLM